jgi:hypothetical protein
MGVKAEWAWFVSVKAKRGERMQAVNPVKLTRTSSMKKGFIGGEKARDVL